MLVIVVYGGCEDWYPELVYLIGCWYLVVVVMVVGGLTLVIFLKLVSTLGLKDKPQNWSITVFSCPLVSSMTDHPNSSYHPPSSPQLLTFSQIVVGAPPRGGPPPTHPLPCPGPYLDIHQNSFTTSPSMLFTNTRVNNTAQWKSGQPTLAPTYFEDKTEVKVD